MLTVSALTALIKESLEEHFTGVCVVGEISALTRAASGHVYLTLKDEHAVLRAIVWRGVAGRLKFDPEEGLEVLVWGDVDVYPPRGTYQLIVKKIEPRGIGALQLAFEQLKDRLAKEGLFREELKKPLPRFPLRIGVVTSPTGAAIRDIINVVSRRFPPAELYLLPARVQGEGAADEIARALDVLNEKRPDLDLIIVARGGGSLEELWPFNEEVVARAIHRSVLPVISAVGHEVDFTISDFVADRRAATPSEAGEIAVPDRGELIAWLHSCTKRTALALKTTVERRRQRLDAAAASYAFRHPDAPLKERAQRTDDVIERLRTAATHYMERLSDRLRGAAGNLEALSPLKVLERGYSITCDDDGTVLRSVEGLREGDRIRTTLARGKMASLIAEIQESGPTHEKEAEDEK